MASFSFSSSFNSKSRLEFSWRIFGKYVIFFFIQLKSFIYRNYPLFTGQISDRFLSHFTRLWFIVGISRATCGSHRGLWWFRKTLFNSISYCTKTLFFCNNTVLLFFQSYFNCSKLPISIGYLICSMYLVCSSYQLKNLWKPSVLKDGIVNSHNLRLRRTLIFNILVLFSIFFAI